MLYLYIFNLLNSGVFYFIWIVIRGEFSSLRIFFIKNVSSEFFPCRGISSKRVPPPLVCWVRIVVIPPRLACVRRPLPMDENLYRTLGFPTLFKRLLVTLSVYTPSGSLQLRKVVTPMICMQPRLSCGAMDLALVLATPISTWSPVRLSEITPPGVRTVVLLTWSSAW